MVDCVVGLLWRGSDYIVYERETCRAPMMMRTLFCPSRVSLLFIRHIQRPSLVVRMPIALPKSRTFLLGYSLSTQVMNAGND
jgi:hypothetical protein